MATGGMSGCGCLGLVFLVAPLLALLALAILGTSVGGVYGNLIVP